jgi:hypothetical protein
MNHGLRKSKTKNESNPSRTMSREMNQGLGKPHRGMNQSSRKSMFRNESQRKKIKTDE